MIWYHYFSLAALLVCIIVMLIRFIHLVKMGNPKDLSQKKGNIFQSEVYSYTVAMMPNKKESAYLHIFSFTAGILFHIATLLCFVLFVLFFFIAPQAMLWNIRWILSLIILIGAFSGFALFIKRMLVKKMRNLSNLDDYLSNFLTTFFQMCTILYLLLGNVVAPLYYIVLGILCLYMPIGKLKHVLYFFAARYHLGFFYGWRGSWPPKKY